MEVELTDHLGYEPHQEPPGGAGNTQERVDVEDVDHRARARWRSRRRAIGTGRLSRRSCASVSGVLRGSTTRSSRSIRRGLSTRDIEAHLEEIYGVKVGRDLISQVTDAVMDDARAWQTRPLDDVYPVVFLDALVLKIRDGGRVQRRACYLALAIGMDGERDVLGMWFQANEGAKFWMQVLTDLKQRGVQDILICCVDGLKGFPEAIEAVFPQTTVQTCIVHLIRHSLKYVPRRQYDAVVKDLRPIYTAIDADAALIGARGVRGEMGPAAAGDRPGLAIGLGARDPVHGLRARGPPGDLHDERDRGAQPPAPQSDQDQGPLPDRGRRPEAALPRDPKRRARNGPGPAAGRRRCSRSKSTSETDYPTNPDRAVGVWG